MANATRTVRVRFDGTATGLNRAAKQAERDLERVRAKASSLRDGAIKFGAITGLVGAIGSLGGPAVAGGVAAVGALAGVAGTAMLAFSGTGDAVEAFNKALESGDYSEYEKELKKLPKSQQAMVRELVKTQQEFKKLKTTAADNALPGITNAIKASRDLLPTLDAAVARSGKVISDTGDDFADLFRSKDFQRNLDGWSRAVEPVERSIGRFLVNTTGQLAKFGSEQKEAAAGFASFLDSTSDGLGDMFDELAPYSADFKLVWESLGDIIEEVLPIAGRFFGEAARTWGPILRDVADFLGENRDEIRDWAGAIAEATPYLLGLAIGLKGLKTAAAAVDFAQVIGRMVGLGGAAEKAGKTTGGKFVSGIRGGLGGAAAAGLGVLVFANVAGSFATQDWKGLGTTYGNYVLSGFQDNANKAASLDFGGVYDNMLAQGRRTAAEVRKLFNFGKTTTIPFVVSVNTEQARNNLDIFRLQTQDIDTKVKIGADTVTASQALEQVVTAINEGQGEVEINGQTIPADAALQQLVSELNTTHGTVNIDGNAVPAGDALLGWINQANGAQGPVIRIDGDPNPATGKIQSVLTNADGSTGTITLDGNATPVGNKTIQAVTFANGSKGTVTIDGNQTPANGKVQATVRYADGSTGTVTVAASNGPAIGTLGQTKGAIDRTKGTVGIQSRDENSGSVLSGIRRVFGSIITQVVRTVVGGAAGGPIGQVAGVPGYKRGGPIFGPGTGTSDSIPAVAGPRRHPIRVANNEHIVTEREVMAAGGHGAVYRIRRAMLDGSLRRFLAAPGYAGGGQVTAARQILSRMRNRQQMFEDWSWRGMSDEVRQWNDHLLGQLKRSGMDPVSFLEKYIRDAERQQSAAAARVTARSSLPTGVTDTDRIIAAVNGLRGGTGASLPPNVAVTVMIDGQEFRGMMRTEIAADNANTRRLVGSGSGRGW